MPFSLLKSYTKLKKKSEKKTKRRLKKNLKKKTRRQPWPDTMKTRYNPVKAGKTRSKSIKLDKNRFRLETIPSILSSEVVHHADAVGDTVPYINCA